MTSGTDRSGHPADRPGDLDAATAAARGEAAARIALVRGTRHVATLFEADGTIIWISPSTEQVMGYTADELVGTDVRDLVHPHDRELVEHLLEHSRRLHLDGSLDLPDAAATLPVRMRHKDGGWRAQELMGNNLLGTEGVNAILTVGRDVTPRQTLDRALTAMAQDPMGEAVFRRLVRSIERFYPALSMALVAAEEEPSWVLGSTPPELAVGHGPWRETFRTGRTVTVEDLPEAPAHLVPDELRDRALAAGFAACTCVAVSGPTQVLGPDNRRDAPGPPLGVLVAWSGEPGPLSIGQLGTIEWMGGLANLALQRRRDVRAQRSLLETEQALNRRLMEIDTARNELFRDISHELRTPLTSIVSFTELLRDGLGSDSQEDQEQFLEIVARSAQRMLRLVGDLSLLSSMESGGLETAGEPIEVGELVERAVAALRPDADERKIDLECEAGPGPAMRGDDVRLVQLVDNLVSNAIKYTPEGGRVQVRAQPGGDGWVIQVEDTGIGIPAEEQARAFDKFFRASNARERQISGSGLGLAIAQGIAAIHRGEITMRSVPERGSTFVVTLRGLPGEVGADARLPG